MAKASRLSGVVLALVLTALAMAIASPADVNIFNDMEGEELFVTCRKAGVNHDFGEKSLLYGEHLGWGFTPNYWGTTKYSCSFRWHFRFADFQVWVDDGIIGVVTLRPCTHCIWTVKQQGFFRNERGQKWLFIHAWR